MKIKLKIKKTKSKDSKFVAKAVIIDKNKILLLKRSEYLEKHKGEWDLPGGHIQEGEELIAGLVREVKEETNLDILQPKMVFGHKNDSFFVCHRPNGEITLSNEHIEHTFVDIKEINDLQSITTYYRDAILKCYEVYEQNEQFS